MPPKTKVTGEMIVEAAFQIARDEGYEKINARAVAEKLNCSTQPVLYQFSTIEALKLAAYQRADAFHTAYIMDVRGRYASPMLEIGLLYIQFAGKEPNLFRFLFQSNRFSNRKLSDLTDDVELEPILRTLALAINTDVSRAKEIFIGVFLLAHGLASMLANNAMQYDETQAIRLLQCALRGLIYSMEEGGTDHGKDEIQK